MHAVTSTLLWLEEVLSGGELPVHLGLGLRGREGRVGRLLPPLQRLLPLGEVALLELRQEPLPVLVLQRLQYGVEKIREVQRLAKKSRK